MSIWKYKVIHEINECTIILYIKPGNPNVEFAQELGREELQKETADFIRKKFGFIAKKTIKVMMGATLLATFTIAAAAPSRAAAEENIPLTNPQVVTTTETETPTLEPVTTQPATDTTTPATETTTPATETTPATDMQPATNTGDTTTTPTTEPAAEAPSLVPGDFFYFVKIMVEKVQLALTFDDAAKAQKLADFAGERIAEARVLIANGDTTGAADLLTKALESQDLALNYTEEAGITPTDPAATDNQTTTDEQQQLQEVKQQIKGTSGQNILALLGALQNVKNPQAQASLMKNIEKSFNKLETRLGKLDQLKNQQQGKELQDKITNLMDETKEDTDAVNKTIDKATPPTTDQGNKDNGGAGIIIPGAKKNEEKKTNPSQKQNQNQEKKQEAKNDKGERGNNKK